MSLQKSILIIFSMWCSSVCFAQVNPNEVESAHSIDSMVVDTIMDRSKEQDKEEVFTEGKDTLYNTLTPKRVAMYSALIPGIGQYKNKQYWKMPIVYIGLGVATYFVIDNRNEYNYYRSIYAGRLSNDPSAFEEMPEYDMETLRRARDFYRKNMELSVILGVAGYGIQIIDALIFAHLKDFDISDDLSIRLQIPKMSPQTLGLAIALKF